MKFFRLDLLTLLISLFILNSCKNQDTIGLSNGSGQLNGSIVDTSTVFTNTVAEDSVPTSALAKSPLGYLNDPVFGTSEADYITDLNLPIESAYTVPTGSIVIDSAILILKYADGFYGDSTAYYTANVYQLNERQYLGQTYYNTKVWNYNSGTVIGTKTFRHNKDLLLDTVTIDTLRPGLPDTLQKVSPQLRIPLDPNFIRGYLFNPSYTTSNLIFRNAIKGLFVSFNKSSVTGTGGVVMLEGDSSSINVYARVLNGTVIDTSTITLAITQHAAQIKRTYSTQVQKALNLSAQNTANHTNISDSLMYLEGLAGTRGKISFPYIKDIFKAIGSNNVVINRAELVVTVPNGSDIPAYLVPLPKLTLYRYDIAHTPISVEDAVSSSNVFFGVPEFGGYYAAATQPSPFLGNYHFLVTAYVQDLIAGRTVDYGTFIAPVDTTNITSVDNAPTPQTAARSIVIGNDKSSPYRIKLNVIYTKTNTK